MGKKKKFSSVSEVFEKSIPGYEPPGNRRKALADSGQDDPICTSFVDDLLLKFEKRVRPA